MRFLYLFALMSGLYSASLLAEPKLHLLFHMGIGSSGQYFVGGTLENNGDASVYRGFVVISPLTIDCHPEAPLLWSFGEIKEGEKLEFKIPVPGRLHGYKLNTLHAVDSFGIAVSIVDETAEVIENKKQAYLGKCREHRINSIEKIF